MEVPASDEVQHYGDEIIVYVYSLLNMEWLLSFLLMVLMLKMEIMMWSPWNHNDISH